MVQEGCKALWPFRVTLGPEGGVFVGEDKSRGNLYGHSVPQPRAHLTPPAHTHIHISRLQDTVSNVTGPLPLRHFTPSGLWGDPGSTFFPCPMASPGPQPLSLLGPHGSLLSSKHFHKLGLDSQGGEGGRQGGGPHALGLSQAFHPLTAAQAHKTSIH